MVPDAIFVRVLLSEPATTYDIDILAEWRVWALIDRVRYGVLVIIIILSLISATIAIPVVVRCGDPVGLAIRTVVIDILEAITIVISVLVHVTAAVSIHV